MSQAKTGDKVQVHYTGKLEDGTEFDSSAGREPLELVIGNGDVISGFEKAVEGMSVGERKSVKISPEDAYGPHNNQLIQEVPKSALPNDLQPEVGMRLEARGSDGNVVHLTVTAISEDSFTVDPNHSLAGKTLNFDIELVGIA